MLFTKVCKLEDRTNQLKKNLAETVRITGLNSQDTLRCSQKLDELITIYQKEMIDTIQE